MTQETPSQHSSQRDFAFATVAIHTGSHPDPATNAVIAPIGVSTTFAQSEIGTNTHEVATTPESDLKLPSQRWKKQNTVLHFQVVVLLQLHYWIVYTVDILSVAMMFTAGRIGT